MSGEQAGKALAEILSTLRELREAVRRSTERIDALEAAASKRAEQERQVADYQRRMLAAGALGRPEEVSERASATPPEGQATAEQFCAIMDGLAANGLQTIPRGGVIPARAAWAQLCSRPDAPKLADVLQGLKLVAPKWKAKHAAGEPQFVPNLSTWIARRGWDEELAAGEQLTPVQAAFRKSQAKAQETTRQSQARQGQALTEEEDARRDRQEQARRESARGSAQRRDGEWKPRRSLPLPPVRDDAREVCDICRGEHDTSSCPRYPQNVKPVGGA